MVAHVSTTLPAVVRRSFGGGEKVYSRIAFSVLDPSVCVATCRSLVFNIGQREVAERPAAAHLVLCSNQSLDHVSCHTSQQLSLVLVSDCDPLHDNSSIVNASLDAIGITC